jgi:hypothetical protein
VPRAATNSRVTASRQHAYASMRSHGVAKTKAAKIANAGRTKAGRVAMARKAARTRARRGKR